jgi:hypothetical protein
MYGNLDPVLKEVPDYKREALRRKLVKKKTTDEEVKPPQTQDDIAKLIMKRKRGF